MAEKRKQEEGQLEFAHKWQHPDSKYNKFLQETDRHKALAMYYSHKDKRRKQKENQKLQEQQKQGEERQQEQGAAAGSAGGDTQQAPEKGAAASSGQGDEQQALEQGAAGNSGEGAEAEGEEKQPESDFEESWNSTQSIAWPEDLSPDWCAVVEESQVPSP